MEANSIFAKFQNVRIVSISPELRNGHGQSTVDAMHTRISAVAFQEWLKLSVSRLGEDGVYLLYLLSFDDECGVYELSP